MKILYFITILFFCIAFLHFEHFYPWMTYDSEKFIFYLFTIIFLHFSIKNQNKIKINTIVFFLVLLFIISLNSYQYYLFDQYFIVFNIYLLNLIILSVVLCNFDYERDQLLDVILIGLVFSGTISAILSIYQWLGFAQDSIFVYKSGGSRFYANLAQPNHLSTLLMLSILSCVYIFNKFNLKLILFFIPLLLFSLVLTQSRSAGLALIIIVIIVFIKWKIIERSIKFILFSLIPLYFGIAELLSRINQKIDIVERMSGSFERLAIWQDFFSVFSHLGLLGTGWKNIEYYQFQYGSNFSGYLSSYHNIFFDLVVIFGMFGGVFFTYLFFKILVLFFRLNTTTDFIVFLMLFVLINHSLLEFPLFYSYFLFVFCILYFYLGEKYSNYVFNLSVNRLVFLISSILVIGLSFLYTHSFEKNRSNYRAAFLGYCVPKLGEDILFDEFNNLAFINCKENISLKNISYFESGLLSRPSSNNILRLIYVYHQVGLHKKRDQLLKKYNARYLPQYNLNDVLKMKFY